MTPQQQRVVRAGSARHTARACCAGGPDVGKVQARSALIVGRLAPSWMDHGVASARQPKMEMLSLERMPAARTGVTSEVRHRKHALDSEEQAPTSDALWLDGPHGDSGQLGRHDDELQVHDDGAVDAHSSAPVAHAPAHSAGGTPTGDRLFGPSVRFATAASAGGTAPVR